MVPKNRGLRVAKTIAPLCCLLSVLGSGVHGLDNFATSSKAQVDEPLDELSTPSSRETKFEDLPPLRRSQQDARNLEVHLKGSNNTVPAEAFCDWLKIHRRDRNVTNISPLLQGRAVEPFKYHGSCKHSGRVFGSGLFKTGTTSLAFKLKALQYVQCHITRGYFSLPSLVSWYHHPPSVVKRAVADRELRHFMRTVSTATLSAADGPWLFFYKEFDEWYPGSKFVLTVRRSLRALVNDDVRGAPLRTMLRRALLAGRHGGPPLARAKAEVERHLQAAILVARRYEEHNRAVREHFKDRPGDFLELCVDCKKTNDRTLNGDLLDFLGCPLDKSQRFPNPEGISRGRGKTPFLEHSDTTATPDWLRWDGNYKLEPSPGDGAPTVIADARHPLYAGTDADPRQVLSLLVERLLSEEKSRILNRWSKPAVERLKLKQARSTMVKPRHLSSKKGASVIFVKQETPSLTNTSEVSNAHRYSRVSKAKPPTQNSLEDFS
mmetsp:Transcript_15264/g.32888  ORF Transcript_15264/g.32888 Transcript_15264/m.32888 type:complete len:492 (-) Transcript_15264:221-1696(-)